MSLELVWFLWTGGLISDFFFHFGSNLRKKIVKPLFWRLSTWRKNDQDSDSAHFLGDLSQSKITHWDFNKKPGCSNLDKKPKRIFYDYGVFFNFAFLLCPFLFVAETASPSSTSDSNSQRSFNELNRAIRREVTRLSERWSNLILQADRWQTKVWGHLYITSAYFGPFWTPPIHLISHTT